MRFPLFLDPQTDPDCQPLLVLISLRQSNSVSIGEFYEVPNRRLARWQRVVSHNLSDGLRPFDKIEGLEKVLQFAVLELFRRYRAQRFPRKRDRSGGGVQHKRKGAPN